LKVIEYLNHKILSSTLGIPSIEKPFDLSDVISIVEDQLLSKLAERCTSPEGMMPSNNNLDILRTISEEPAMLDEEVLSMDGGIGGGGGGD
jgi:hypothetical protein